jgi:hypothetical protein
MFVTVVAVMCHLITAQATIAADGDCTAEEQRIEEIVTDTDRDDKINFFACMIGAQIALADWKAHHPIYFKAGWRISRIKCVPGHYEPKAAV